MAELGRNLKVTAPVSTRDANRALMVQVFGADVAVSRDHFDIYRLKDGTNVGIFCVPDADALTPEQAKKGVWIELKVENPAETKEALAGIDIRPFEYMDKDHDYYQAPAGFVFRVAKLG